MCALTARVRPPGSIHNDRRLLCQPVCQHRIPGQQLSEHPTAVSVLVPLIKINKETTKFKKKKEVPQKGGRRKFETRKYPPAQPHRKAKLRRRQPLSPSLLQPGYPCVPKPPSSGSPRKGSQRSCTPAAKQKEACYADSAKQRTNRKKGCNKTAFLLPSPAFPGRSSQLAGRPPRQFLGTPPSAGPKLP